MPARESHSLLRQSRAGGVDLGCLRSQVVLLQLDAIGAEGVGLDDLRAGGEIFGVCTKNERGLA